MKTRLQFLLLFCLFFPAILNAQSLPGAWGLNFGMSSEDAAKKIETEKHYRAPVIRNYQNEKLFVYKDVRFGDFTADSICLSFTGNKLYYILVMFPYQKDPYECILTYITLKKEITATYFEPQSDREFFIAPYDKDSDKGAALDDNKLSMDCEWKFKPASAPQNIPACSNCNCSIVLKISNNLRFTNKGSQHNVILSYTDGSYLAKGLAENDATTGKPGQQGKTDF